MSNLSLAKDKIKILLLEGIHQNAVDSFKAHGYNNVELLPGALDGDELKAKIADAHMVGIRSRTKLTADILEAADKLMAIGCFCIGTNQVDLSAARDKGVPVFNAPYSNTRSVAELVIAEIIMLARGVPHKNTLAHAGGWLKSAEGSYEVRGKILGVIGYGHIGSQVSVLAESLGMKVRYFDIIDKLPLGNAAPCDTMEELLEISDFVSLHVPATPQTNNMFRREHIFAMKPGALLINLARGNVVDINALVEALDNGHLSGAGIDVFPQEPASKNEEFTSPLRGQPNVILTPHVGGSTQEAQANIGNEVTSKLVRYSDNGSTLGTVNFVEVSLPVQDGVTRFLHIHRNVPGVLSSINEVFSERGLNIAGQYLMTDGEVGYVVVDVSGDLEAGMGVRKGLAGIEGTIRTRFLA
ncbi:MAG: phosphoglycerate dehydrogenase [Rhodospirillales bacterium]|nr:phosphoglycerate dehydrogenase [Rhodospirillales bacterium]